MYFVLLGVTLIRSLWQYILFEKNSLHPSPYAQFKYIYLEFDHLQMW